MENSNIIYVIQSKDDIGADVNNSTYREVTTDETLDAYTSVIQYVQEEGLRHRVPEELSGENEKFRWNNNSVKLLLEVRLEKEALFNRPSCKKKKLWQSVANEINKIAKLNVTSELCDIKYRNLLATYRANKKKQNSSGESSITWEYFDIFDAVLGHKASSMPPTTNLGDSLADTADIADDEADNNDNIREDETSNESHETVQSNSSCEVKNTSERKRKSEISLQTYLQQKLQKQEKREEEKKAHEENKLKFEKEKWEEKKMLKEKEIEALLALARALAESK